MATSRGVIAAVRSSAPSERPYRSKRSVTSPVVLGALSPTTTMMSAARTLDVKEPLLRSDWTIYRGGAVSSSNETVDLYLRPYF
jgi:hypothetical protein